MGGEIGDGGGGGGGGGGEGRMGRRRRTVVEAGDISVFLFLFLFVQQIILFQWILRQFYGMTSEAHVSASLRRPGSDEQE